MTPRPELFPALSCVNLNSFVRVRFSTKIWRLAKSLPLNFPFKMQFQILICTNKLDFMKQLSCQRFSVKQTKLFSRRFQSSSYSSGQEFAKQQLSTLPLFLKQAMRVGSCELCAGFPPFLNIVMSHKRSLTFDFFSNSVHFLSKKEGKLHYRTAKLCRSRKMRLTSIFENGIRLSDFSAKPQYIWRNFYNA